MNGRTRFVWAALLAGLLAGSSALAHGGGRPYYPRSSVQFGVYIGDPWFYPAYPRPYYWPHYYLPPVAPVIVTPPPVYIEQSAPPVYVEKPAAPPAASPSLESGFWYYCGETRAYYPYVKECPGGWQKVAPAPAK